MRIDRERLAALDTQRPTPPQGIQGLLRSIHSAPDLRDWVTLESTPFPPVPVKTGSGWSIITLLATPAPPIDGKARYHAPWGAIIWSWPEGIAAKGDLKAVEGVPPADTIFAADPPAGAEFLVPSEQRERLEALCHALEALDPTTAVTEEEMEQLGQHYSALLPKDAYVFYHALAPETRAWLRPELAPFPRKQMNSEPVQETAAPAAPASGSPSPPSEVGASLGKWLREAHQLAQAYGLTQMAQEIMSLDLRRRATDFRLMFIGEFSRGKSTLINRLLEREILPSGALPTTASFVSVIAGEQERMEVRQGDGEWMARPLCEDSWQDLLAVDLQGMSRNVEAAVRLVVHNDWLQKLHTELMDTPGAGDTDLKRTETVLETLGRADAAVMVVSADSPFSLSEAAFLENEVLGRRLSRLLIAVSKFDLIAMEEREQALEVLRSRVRRVAPALLVLPLQAIRPGDTDEAALKAVRLEIEQLVARGDRGLWRNRHIAEVLSDRLGTMARLAQEAIRTARLSQEERTVLRQKAEGKLQDADLHWEKLRLELEERRMKASGELRRNMQAAQGDLIESLAFELSRMPDPKSWWERDMPFRLKREITALGQRCEQQVLAALARDANWLQQETTHAFGLEIARTPTEGRMQSQEEVAPSTLDLTDLQRTRLFSRIGSGVVLVGGYLLGLGPLSIAASLAAGIISEHTTGKQLEDQRRLVRNKIAATVERAVDAYSEAVSERLRRLYNQLLADSRRSQEAWKSSHLSVLRAPASAAEVSWQELAESAARLRQSVVRALEG